jgi:hypothetical protein
VLQMSKTFNDRSSLKKHHDRGIRACVPWPASLSQVAVPGTFMILVAAAHFTASAPPPPPPEDVLGHEMSLFASALDAQDGMSVSSKEVEKQCSDFPEDDGKLDVAKHDDADGRNSTATIGYAVPAYSFMLWIDGYGPHALATGDRFFLRGKVDLSDEEEEVGNFLSQSCDSNPADHFKFVPLPLSGHATDCQDSVPE